MDSKISFGFKKLPKKPSIIGAKPPEEKKVELIECLDSQNIKIIGHVEEDKKPLVIPMQGANKNLLDRIKDANDLKERSRIKYKSNGIKEKKPEIDLRPDSELTLEELAARKLIEEAKTYEKRKTAIKVTKIAIEDQLILEGAKEPTINDYESVPIEDFGMAMLRGMGWSEDQRTDNMKVSTPQIRPKGMGLGASIPGNTRNKIPLDKSGKELKLVKDAKARIIAGKEKGNYCIVQGLDDDSGRIIVVTTLTGTILSLNEFMLFPVSDEEYAQFSKVLNNVKYQKYSQKAEQNLKKVKDENDEKDEVEHVPNGNDVMIEISSASESEKDRCREQIQKQEHNIKVKVRKSRCRNRSRSKTPTNLSSKSRKEALSSRKLSTSGDGRTSRSSRCMDASERRSSRSRSEHKITTSIRNKDKYLQLDVGSKSSDQSDEDYKKKEKKVKSNKSKGHKRIKSKRDKKEKKLQRYSTSSSRSSSERSDAKR